MQLKHSDFSVLEIIFKIYEVERWDDFLSISIFLAPSSRKLISDCIPVFELLYFLYARIGTSWDGW